MKLFPFSYENLKHQIVVFFWINLNELASRWILSGEDLISCRCWVFLPGGVFGSSFALWLLNSRDGGRAGGALCEKTDKLVWSQSRQWRRDSQRYEFNDNCLSEMYYRPWIYLQTGDWWERRQIKPESRQFDPSHWIILNSMSWRTNEQKMCHCWNTYCSVWRETDSQEEFFSCDKTQTLTVKYQILRIFF